MVPAHAEIFHTHFDVGFGLVRTADFHSRSDTGFNRHLDHLMMGFDDFRQAALSGFAQTDE